MIIAAVVAGLALTVGILRTADHDRRTSAPAPTAPVVSAVPSVAPAPSAVPAPSGHAASGSAEPSLPSEPVEEGAGADGSARDAGPDSTGQDAADRRAWEPVATGFGRAFTAVHSGDATPAWQARLRPYVTAAVDKQLATVDVGNVPRGRFDGLDVLDASTEQVTVQATYDPGWALVLYLVSDGHHDWKVYRYDRLEQ